MVLWVVLIGGSSVCGCATFCSPISTPAPEASSFKCSSAVSLVWWLFSDTDGAAFGGKTRKLLRLPKARRGTLPPNAISRGDDALPGGRW